MTDIPTEALEAATGVYVENTVPSFDHAESCGTPCSCYVLDEARETTRSILAAAAPHLIAEGRRQAAAAIRAEGPRETETKFWFHGEERYESGAEWAARIAEGGDPVARADKHLRESRERQAGLDFERIERAREAAEARSRRANVLGAEWAARIEADGADHG